MTLSGHGRDFVSIIRDNAIARSRDSRPSCDTVRTWRLALGHLDRVGVASRISERTVAEGMGKKILRKP